MCAANRKLLLRQLRERPVRPLVLVAFALFLVGLAVVLGFYPGSTFWPGLVGGFGASLAAFMLALSWDHERERRQTEEAAAAAAENRKRELEERRDRLATEARRRLKPLRDDLSRNKESADFLVKSLPKGTGAPQGALHPELLEGAWVANAPRLIEILADYELTSNLASTYGRIEELRWRIRLRTQLLGVNLNIATEITEKTRPLAEHLAEEIADVLARVEQAIEDPPVELRGIFAGATVEALVVVDEP